VWGIIKRLTPKLIIKKEIWGKLNKWNLYYAWHIFFFKNILVLAFLDNTQQFSKGKRGKPCAELGRKKKKKREKKKKKKQ
jgi:hypothetical protein